MISTIITNPSEKDIPSLRKLWKDIFGDDDSYLDLFFKVKYNPETTFVIKENKEIVAMLYAEVNTVIKNKKELTGAYLCGIATKESSRGKGYASKLIEYALENLKGIDVFYLIPAEESLFEYYKRFGFEPFSYFDKTEIQPEEVDKIPGYTEDFSYDLLNGFYEATLNGCYIKRSYEDFKAIYDCYKRFMIFDDGYIVYYISKGILTITEYTIDFEKADLTGKYLMAKNQLEKGYILKRNGKTPFSAYKSSESFDKIDKYVNLMLN